MGVVGEDPCSGPGPGLDSGGEWALRKGLELGKENRGPRHHALGSWSLLGRSCCGIWG